MADVDKKFAEIMVALAEGYPNMKLREGTIRIYARALNDLTLEQFQAAAFEAIKESEFFPTVAYIRKCAQPSADDAGLIAWTALQRAASTVGAYASVEFEDRAAAAALITVFGSWPKYCEMEGPAIGARRHEFLAAYRDARRAKHLRGRPRLLGLCDVQNDGHYATVPGAWIGRITAKGEVVAVTERALMAATKKSIG